MTAASVEHQVRGEAPNIFGRHGIAIGIQHNALQTDAAPHRHDFTELVIVTGGHGDHVSGAHRMRVGAGDVFVVTPAMTHGYANTQGLSLFNVFFDEHKLGFSDTDLEDIAGYRALFRFEPAYRNARRFPCHLHLSQQQLAALVTWARELERQLGERAPGFRFSATISLMQIISYLARAYDDLNTPQSQRLVRVSQAVSYIERNLQQAIHMPDLARTCGMSESTLLRAFRHVMHTTPAQYITALRIERAQLLLRDTEQSVTEVAVCAGFEDPNYFSRAFKRLTGLNPRAYRHATRATGTRSAATRAGG